MRYAQGVWRRVGVLNPNGTGGRETNWGTYFSGNQLETPEHDESDRTGADQISSIVSPIQPRLM